MESNFKKILLTSTVFTCLSSGLTVVMANDEETTASDNYHKHHNANFVAIAADNPIMKAIQDEQQAHRNTIMADVALMLGTIQDSTVRENLKKLKNIIGSALTADADAINDIENAHKAKTSTSTETVATLTKKANTYAKEINPNGVGVNPDHQHYRLAHFLMFKLKPWITNNYRNAPEDAENILADQIPTHYPDWPAGSISKKELKVKLVSKEYKSDEPALIYLPIAKKINTTDVYNLSGQKIRGASIQQSKDQKSVTISGISKYGVYFVQDSNNHRYYFAVNNTQQDEFIYDPKSSDSKNYDPKSIVKITATPNDALTKANNLVPTLTLISNNKAVDESTFSASLDGTTWKKLSELSSADFLKAERTILFKGLSAGSYTFKINSPNPQQFPTQETSFKVLPQIISPTATAYDKTYDGKSSATATLTSPTPGVQINGATFDDSTVEPNKEVTVPFAFDKTLSRTEKANYILVPMYSTRASILEQQTTTTLTTTTTTSSGGVRYDPATHSYVPI